MYAAVLTHFAYRYVPSDVAENIVQDVFVDIWKRDCIDEINGISYLLSAVRNRCINYLRNEEMRHFHNEKIIAEAQFDDSFLEDSIEQKIIEDEKMQRIYRYVDQLPEQRKKVFRMAYINGKNNSEIAELLQLSVSTVKHHIYLALKTLREQLNFF